VDRPRPVDKLFCHEFLLVLRSTCDDPEAAIQGSQLSPPIWQLATGPKCEATNMDDCTPPCEPIGVPGGSVGLWGRGGASEMTRRWDSA
jgi:hypothetical protein